MRRDENSSGVSSSSSFHRGNHDDDNQKAVSIGIEEQQHRQQPLALDDHPNSSDDDELSELQQVNEDWEEWDGRSPFWVHCAAGSLAGVVEHTVVYPLDTVRTHIQVCAACVKRLSVGGGSAMSSQQQPPHWNQGLRLTGSGTSSGSAQPHSLPTGMWQTLRYLMNESAATATASTTALRPALAATTTAAAATESLQEYLYNLAHGWSRLWRGVPVILMGCVPAHALYFSSFELVKAATSTRVPLNPSEPGGNNATTTLHVTPLASSAAGATATLSHDLIMTPMDTVKQRMQLGHYEGVSAAFQNIIRQEGFSALYRSFSITLLTNVPYGAVMVTVNETCKQTWASPDVPHWQTVLASSSLAGLVASAVTTPLDRIKTALQTQELEPACLQQQRILNSGASATSRVGTSAAAVASSSAAAAPACQRITHANWQEAARYIWQQEGPRGFLRGILPRILSHTPAVAISWTTYESAKAYLLKNYAAS